MVSWWCGGEVVLDPMVIVPWCHGGVVVWWCGGEAVLDPMVMVM